MKKSVIIIIVVALVFIAAAVYFYVYNKPHRDVVGEEAAMTVTATELYNAFVNNPEEANKTYLNKVIQVSGIVSDMTILNDNDVKLVLSGGDAMFGVACTFDDEHARSAQNLDKGSKTSIKGLCTGYSGDDIMPGDVVLVKCTIVD